jgi:hypothetical protein
MDRLTRETLRIYTGTHLVSFIAPAVAEFSCPTPTLRSN